MWFRGDLESEALTRALYMCRAEMRSLLSSIGLDPFEFDHDGESVVLRADLPLEQRNALLQYADPLGAAIAHISPAKRVVLSSPGCRDRSFPAVPNDGLLDLSLSAEQRDRLRQVKLLNARYRAILSRQDAVVDVIDRQGRVVDCNYTTRKSGMERDAALGKSVYLLFPDVADVSHHFLREAYAYPERPICREFAINILGCPVQVRCKAIVCGDDLISIIENVTPYPWL